jgi:short-subunit dehydrogenase
MTALLGEFDAAHPIDLLVANAGILDGRHADQVVEDRQAAREVLETNLLATIDVIHAVLGGMLERRAGDIVLVSSLAAFAPLADAPAYSASKAGLVSYGLGLRDAVASEGIRVTVACPGFVSTNMAGTHIGPRPEEMSADDAAIRILDGWARNKAVIGFPTVPYWFTRLCLLLPESIRRSGLGKTRFHVARPSR